MKNEDNNIKVLDEANKGCCMGRDALEVIMEKTDDKEFKECLKKYYDKYDKIGNKMEDLYDEFSDEKIDETSKMEKTMTWYGINMRTMMDDSTSKFSELILQGANMGIIEGRRLLNHNKDIDNEVNRVVDEFVKMQEKMVEELKDYL